MKILITGGAGQLGTELQRQLAAGKSALGPLPEALQNVAVVAVDMADADLSSLTQTRELLQKHRPDAVINCAAFTNVDLCETQPETAFEANALGARNVAMACEEIGAKLVHVSTDYVLSGDATQPLSEGAIPAPQSVYGTTKYLGEQYVQNFCSRWFIARTSWLYGRQGNNFVKTILRLAKEQGQLKVVNDQVGNPTNGEDLAHHLLLLTLTEEYGIYHCTGNGICSWYDFAAEIVRLSGIEASVQPVSSEEFPRPAKRPAYSALAHTMLSATIGDEMRPWKEALAEYLQELGEQ